MAGNGLTRKFMTALGVSSEAQDEIIAKYDEVLTDIKTERDTYKQKAEQLDVVAAERDNWKSKAEDTTAASRIAELEQQVAGYEAEKTNAQKQAALSALLESAGIDKRGFNRIIAATDLSAIELDENGGVKDSTAYAEKLRSDWADLVVTEGQATAAQATPPQTGSSRMTKEQIMEIKDKNERRIAIAQNLDLFESKGE